MAIPSITMPQTLSFQRLRSICQHCIKNRHERLTIKHPLGVPKKDALDFFRILSVQQEAALRQTAKNEVFIAFAKETKQRVNDHA
jgi:hypothetical protein